MATAPRSSLINSIDSIDIPQPLERLEQLILNRQATVGVIGLGYVGLPFAIEKTKVGFNVLGIEQNPKRAEQVNQARSYIDDVSSDVLREAVNHNRLKATTTFDSVVDMDVVVICVPTPLTKNLTPDLSYVEGVAQEIGIRLRSGQLVSLESTTYPGTTDEVIKPILEASSGLKQGKDFFLAHSPERVDPGNQRYTTQNTNKIVGASDSHSLKVAELFYQQTIQDVVPVSSAKAAELVKVFENTFRAVNIALVNELALLCDRLDLNVWEVLDAANTKPFGIMPFYPGPGVGGHCIPIDPHYLEWKAKEVNFNTRFIALAGEINRRMPSFVRSKAFRVLNQLGIAPSKAKILVLGITYKKDLADWRESPAVSIIQLLAKDQVTLSYHDPYISEVSIAGQCLSSIALTPETVAGADLVLIATDHSCIDYGLVVTHAQAILDTRGVTRTLDCDRAKVTLL